MVVKHAILIICMNAEFYAHSEETKVNDFPPFQEGGGGGIVDKRVVFLPFFGDGDSIVKAVTQSGSTLELKVNKIWRD